MFLQIGVRFVSTQNDLEATFLICHKLSLIVELRRDSFRNTLSVSMQVL